MRRDPLLNTGGVALSTIRAHVLEVERLRVDRSLTLFGITIKTRAYKAPVEQEGDPKARKQHQTDLVISAVRAYADAASLRFHVTPAAVSSRVRKRHTCPEHPTAETIWIPVDGPGPDGQRVSGMLTVCATCGGVNDFDDTIDIGLYRIAAEPTPQTVTTAREDAAEKPKKARASGQSISRPALQAAG